MTTPASQVVGDLSTLPDSADGPRSLLWWSNLGFMMIEGTGFALAVGAYLYLQSQSAAWPPVGDLPPGLLWSGIFTIGLLVSQWPNLWVSTKAKEKDVKAVRLGVLAMTLAGAALLAARGYELSSLNVRWERDAYGSVTWMLMVLHTMHVITDLLETAVLSLWLYTHEVGDDQFADVEDNANYWSFVVVAWLPIYAIVYWAPRLT
ncbi:MAG: cytochrome oxidase subunit [Rhizobacter sp.]|nr:cytochrome oxidase subunit [Rhizobacter sp.]